MSKKEKKHDPYAPWLSVWILTYNTNRTSNRYIKIVEEAWQEILRNLIKYTRAYSSPTIKITSVRELHTIERGDKYHKIHLHSDLEIESLGLTMLDYDSIKLDMDDIIRELYMDAYEDREDYTPYTQGYFNGRIVKNANAARKILAYLEKAPLLKLKKKSR